MFPYFLSTADFEKMKSTNAASELFSIALSFTRRVRGKNQSDIFLPVRSVCSARPRVKLRLVTPNLYVILAVLKF